MSKRNHFQVFISKKYISTLIKKVQPTSNKNNSNTNVYEFQQLNKKRKVIFNCSFIFPQKIVLLLFFSCKKYYFVFFPYTSKIEKENSNTELRMQDSSFH